MDSGGVRYYQIADGELPENPVVVPEFDTDRDVLVIANVGLAKKDLRFFQHDRDTVIGLGDGDRELAILKNVNAHDLDPTSLLKSFYKALAANNLSKALSLLADDVLWEVAGPTDIIPWAGAWKGVQGVGQFFLLLSEGLSFEKLTPTRFIAQGNTVAVVLDGSGESRYGVPFSGGVVHWVTVRNGKISHLQYYRDTYPIIEAIYGGRPFTVHPSYIDSHYHVIKPLPSPRNTDSIVFETVESAKPNSTVKTVLSMYAALQGLNATEMKNVLAEDLVWEMFGPADLIAWSGKWIGPDAAMESAREIIKTMQFDQFKAVRLIHQGDTAAIVIDEPGASKVTGLPFHTSVVHIVTTNEEGKVTALTNYVNTAWIVEAFLGGRPFTIA
jgi:ketosteroid isomerase-like protein